MRTSIFPPDADFQATAMSLAIACQGDPSGASVPNLMIWADAGSMLRNSAAAAINDLATSFMAPSFGFEKKFGNSCLQPFRALARDRVDEAELRCPLGIDRQRRRE